MKIISESHLDHGLTEDHIKFIMGLFGSRQEFFIESVELPSELASLQCGLHGHVTSGEPVPDSECSYERRGGREWPSRLCNRAPIKTRTITVIAGPYNGEPCVLFTAYGGPLAPREPMDPSLSTEEKERSEAFWSVHALGR